MDSSTSLLQPLLGLLITFTVLGLVLWGVKALQNKRNIFGGRTIQVIEAASVGTRERIVIADVSGRRLVLGVTAQNINLLTEIEADPVAEAAEAPVPTGEASSFRARLLSSLGQLPKSRGQG